MISNRITSLTELSFAYKKGAGGNYIGCLLDFPGVMSQANSEEKLMENLLDALACMTAYEDKKRQEAVPEFLFDNSFTKSKMKIPVTA